MPPIDPPVLLRGGRIHAADRSVATAMLVEGDRVAWIGTDAARPPSSGPVRAIDLGGRLVTPGFVDAHVHLAKTGLALQSLDLGPAGSLAEALELLRGAAESSHAGGDLLLAHGWDDAGRPERRPFTGAELAAAVGGRPAYASRVDAHSAVVTPALAALDPGILAVPGWRGDGVVERDAHHLARVVVDSLQTPERRRDTLRLALDAVAARGVTAVHDLNAPHISPADDVDLVAELLAERPGPAVRSYWGAAFGGEHADSARVAGFAGDLCIDGSLGSRTAAVVGGYLDAPDQSGHLYLDDLAIRDHVVWCTERGRQAGFHVIGDRALEALERGLRAAADKVGADAIVGCRHRIEHVEMPSPALLDVMARLGIVASVQPAFDAAWGGAHGMYAERVGAARAAAMNPFASMLRAGVTVAFGSDSPVTSVNPWAAIRAAVGHHNEDERTSASTALDAHTRGGHAAAHDDASGVLAVGADASYVIWDLPGADPRSSVSEVLDALGSGRLDVTCARTVHRGVQIFDSGDITDAVTITNEEQQ